MSNREAILQSARQLAIAQRRIPSLTEIAENAGVSKGGLLHHFPSRQDLIRGVVEAAIAEVDTALVEAVEHKGVVVAWLKLSSPSPTDRPLYDALAVAYVSFRGGADSLGRAMEEANERWQQLLEKEVGDPDLAFAVRLIGDGLLLNAIADHGRVADQSDIQRLSQLIDRLARSVEAG